MVYVSSDRVTVSPVRWSVQENFGHDGNSNAGLAVFD